MMALTEINSFYDTVIQVWSCVSNPKSFISLCQPQAQKGTCELSNFLCYLYWVYMYITGFGKRYPLHTWCSNFCLVSSFLPYWSLLNNSIGAYHLKLRSLFILVYSLPQILESFFSQYQNYLSKPNFLNRDSF